MFFWFTISIYPKTKPNFNLPDLGTWNHQPSKVDVNPLKYGRIRTVGSKKLQVKYNNMASLRNWAPRSHHFSFRPKVKPKKALNPPNLSIQQSLSLRLHFIFQGTKTKSNPLSLGLYHHYQTNLPNTYRERERESERTKKDSKFLSLLTRSDRKVP